jgi:hypothetical protein
MFENSAQSGSEILPQVAHHLEVQNDLLQTNHFHDSHATELAKLWMEAGRLGSFACREITGVLTFDRASGAMMKADVVQPTGPTLSQQNRRVFDDPLQVKEQEKKAIASSPIMVVSRHTHCTWPTLPSLSTPTELHVPLPHSLGPISPAFTPSPPKFVRMTAPSVASLPRLDALSSRGPSLFGGTTSPYERRSLGVDYSGISRESQAWGRNMVAKHPWLKP